MTLQGYRKNVYSKPHDVVIMEPTTTPDDFGGFAEGYADGATVKGRVQAAIGTPYGSREVQIGERASVLITHMAYLPPDTVVSRENRIRVGTSTYEVVTVENPGNRGHHLMLQLKQVL